MKQEIYDLRETINSKNPLVRLFFRWKFSKAIEFADLKKEDIILDFGCGGKYLKSILPEYDYVGYDINPKQTEIKDYIKLKPDVIFAIDVFEHIEKEEIRKIIKNFKKMNPNLRLITIIPNETWFWHFSRLILGLSPYQKDHITKRNEIIDILSNELKMERKLCFFYVSYIYRFTNKVKKT